MPQHREKKKLKSTLSELLGKPDPNNFQRRSLGEQPILRSSITLDSRELGRFPSNVLKASSKVSKSIVISNPTISSVSDKNENPKIQLVQNNNEEIKVNSCKHAIEETKIEELADGWF